MPDDAEPADGPRLERQQRVRVAAYVVCTDEAERLLLARWVGPRGPKWTLPGGGLDPGEQPQAAALRELTEETGYLGQLDALVGVDTDRFVGVEGHDLQVVRVIYRAHVRGGELTYETDGSTDMAGWVSPEELGKLDAVPMVGLARRWVALPGRPVRPAGAAAAATRPSAHLAADARARLFVSAIVCNSASPVAVAGRDEQQQLASEAVAHGERFEEAVRRAVRRQTGLDVRATVPTSADSDIVTGGSGQLEWHVRLTYETATVG